MVSIEEKDEVGSIGSRLFVFTHSHTGLQLNTVIDPCMYMTVYVYYTVITHYYPFVL